MQITTTDFIPGSTITAFVDTIFTEQIVSINAIKDVMHSLKGIFGAKMDAYAEEYARTRQQALDDLRTQAEALGADALIDLKLRADQFVNDGLIFVVVSASAVCVKLAPSEQK